MFYLRLMNIQASLLLFLGFAGIVKGEGSCKKMEFLPCEADKHLVGHVFVRYNLSIDRALKNCKHRCYVEHKCISYNLAPIEEDKRVCELSDTDHVEHPDDVISQAGAQYCAIKNPCVSNPCQSSLTCEPDFYLDSFKCIDKTSCAGLKRSGKKDNDVYGITPVPGYTVHVYCDQVTDGGGWTVIQKRLDGSVDFYRGWNDYKRGFGNKNGEYWLGLNAIHILTNSTQNELRVDLKDFNDTEAYALYETFKVSPESNSFKLNVGNFIGGNAGDSLIYFHNGQKFSTFDRDNEKNYTNCAVTFKGAWWYSRCHMSNLNGLYLRGYHTSYAVGINWKTWRGYYYSVKEAQMKIRPADFKP